mmetsp:Transcript_46345/g.108595  ORF Transcript_46345/g.108595 Transcript_46345/m.108595 type:complete len:194 (-) Transcript_46345:52-633(-)
MVQPGFSAKRSRRAEKRQPVKHTELCAFFAEGKCTRGNRCTFAHGASQLRSRPDLYKTRLCSSYMLLQQCPYGESCTHAHGEEELREVGDPVLEVRGLSKEAATSSTASGDCDSELSLSTLVSQFGLPPTKGQVDVHSEPKYVADPAALTHPVSYPMTTPSYATPWGDWPTNHMHPNIQAVKLLASHTETLRL